MLHNDHDNNMKCHMKCRYSAFNAQGSRPIIVVVQLEALKEEKN